VADRDTLGPIVIKPGAIGYKWPMIRPRRSGMVCSPRVAPPHPRIPGSLGPPEFLEPPRTQLGIAHRVLNVLVAQIRLQCARVGAPIRQCIAVAARVAQHVRMHTKL